MTPHYAVFITFEIDNSIALLVTTALMTDRDATVVVTATLFGLLVDQRLVRLTFVQAGCLYRHLESPSSRGRF